jgi:ADP-heptose:LPS heptosyltransferase
MFKEAGDLREAEDHYREALAAMPDDSDLALQFGHLYKVAGRLDEAIASYDRALKLSPGWDEAERELSGLRRAGWRGNLPHAVPSAPRMLEFADAHSRFDVEGAYGFDELAPEQFPVPLADMLVRSEPSINLRQFGVRQQTFHGMQSVLRGVEALRGFCISTAPSVEVTALVNGLPIHRGPLKGPYELAYEVDKERVKKYVFNIWYDFSPFAPGRYSLELRIRDTSHVVRTLTQEFIIEPPLREREHPESDALLTLVPGDPRSLDEQIMARPAVVRNAVRADALDAVKSILVLRTDQLGDTVASLPALRRLRALFPRSTIVGLVTPANADLANTFSAFDELIVVEAPDDHLQRKRVMPIDAQLALKERLAPYHFDLALDLATSHMSRPLLKIAGARLTFGFDDSVFTWMTGGIAGGVHDPKNHSEASPHSSRVVALVDRLFSALSTKAEVSRRPDLLKDRLTAFGIFSHDQFAVLHMGARIRFSRWEGYAQLVEKLHRETSLKIVIFPNDSGFRDELPPEIASSDRIIVITGQLPFDDFDAMLSYCSVYVGNDSGPKHLAALRGVPVVSIHAARINWIEWAQEQTGVVISRKVPCAGCAIYHDIDECGKDFACMKGITLDDVYLAVRRYV